MLQAERISGKKVSDIVVEQIEEWIRSDKVQPGEKLPSVRELSEMFDVGRSAVRDALTTLKGKGIVNVKQGEGTFVCHFDMAQLLPDLLLVRKSDMKKLYQVRRILEVGIAEMAAINATEKQLQLMKEKLDELSSAKTLKGWEADYRFHQAIAEASGNEILVDVMETVSTTTKKGIIASHRIILSDEKLSSDIAEQHIAIYDAIKARDPVKARETMFSHLTYVEKLLNNHLNEVEN
ncbi:FadR/GntR family transcriptional regulator [Pseudogracilibacillus sp. SO30301A]|uniref:FadR/GntR family transcriptional regulator n=1 Tax=Pseudogracilibacillus sp. SO30301A TaxID=3098291 RepID=UPI00300E60B1